MSPRLSRRYKSWAGQAMQLTCQRGTPFPPDLPVNNTLLPAMSLFSWTDCLIVGFLLSVVWILRRVRLNRLRNPLGRPLPPGPAGLPILKNVLDWPHGNCWLTFREWRKAYGDVIHLEMLGEHIIVVNSYAKAREMLDHSRYADRPRFVMAGELMGFAASTMLSPYDDHWKFTRKLTHQGLCKSSASKFWAVHEKDARDFVRLLLEDPANYRQDLRFILGKNILRNAYGIDIKSRNHELITISEGTHHDLALALVPGSYLVDVLPWLKHIPSWFPGAGFQKHAANARIKASIMADHPYEYVKTSFNLGTAPTSFVSTILGQKDSVKPDSSSWDHAVKWAAGSLYGASTEAGFGALSTFFLAMAMNPEIQQKAQKEIDAVVGHDRLPTLADRDDLPYVDALIMETLRWHPPLPVGVAHRAMQDDYFDDFYIPKGSIIIPNEWAMSQDHDIYANPTAFRPERFLGEKPELSPGEWAFGFGRRACPGIHYAMAFMYSIVTAVLATNDIRAQDEAGNNVHLSANFADAFVSFAEAFPCRITPRMGVDAEALLKDDI